MTNKEIYDSLYKKDIELRYKLRPLKFRLENKAGDKLLSREVDKLTKEIDALNIVMSLYK